jgi:hypothetical protein
MGRHPCEVHLRRPGGIGLIRGVVLTACGTPIVPTATCEAYVA